MQSLPPRTSLVSNELGKAFCFSDFLVNGAVMYAVKGKPGQSIFARLRGDECGAKPHNDSAEIFMQMSVCPYCSFEQAGVGTFLAPLLTIALINHFRLMRITYYVAMKLDT